MQLDLERFDQLAEGGHLRQGEWGDGHETACALSAAILGATSDEDCTAHGWPLWLAELVRVTFDSQPDIDTAVTQARRLLIAIQKLDQPDRDWNRVFCDLRLGSILPIAMESIGQGDEDWRVVCRDVVAWSIDNGGQAAEAAWAVGAARAARAAGAAGAAWAVGAARAAWAVGAARAAGAAGAAEAADAAGAAWAAWAARAAEAADAAGAAWAAWAVGAARAAAWDRIILCFENIAREA